MAFWKVGTPPQEEPIKGYYISKSEIPIKFTMYQQWPGIEDITLWLEGSSRGINNAFKVKPGDDGSTYITITKNAFQSFKKDVLDKDMEWKNVEQINKIVPSVPGKWMSTKRMELINEDKAREQAESSISGTVRTHTGGSTHRKPTKRRRNRRGNRKTKKN